jgi:DNA-3-methyladenine glycosylase I
VGRCFGDGDSVYAAYHDDEWGLPVTSEVGLYERLSLEGFQSGLSWLTILKRRDGFRRAFAGFDAELVAAFGAADVERLLGDDQIIRHRGKIEATIANACVVLALRENGTPLPELVWRYRGPAAHGVASWSQIPAQTEASRALAKELRAHGWRFIGPTTAYAAMQACGLVNDHLRGCPARVTVERARGTLD